MEGKDIGLALQGGGAYAAFTAGVLKALLNRRRRFLAADQIRSISGTSGGALNALALGKGLHEGGKNPTHYINCLWQLNRIESVVKKHVAPLHLVPDEFVEAIIGMGRHFTDSTPHLSASMGDQARGSRVLNRLVEQLLRAVDPNLPAQNDVPLLPARRPYVTVAATEVRTTMAHFFTNNARMISRYGKLGIAKVHPILHELTLDGVLASTAHPSAFAPVRIGSNVYWDGYFTSNPPFTYLFREGCEEVILIRLVPSTREEVRSDAAFVRDRTEEIIQTSTLSKEIQSYFEMREFFLANRQQLKGVRSNVAMRSIDNIGIFHEIRLNKPGNITEQGYPFSAFVDKLLGLGEQVVTDRDGFISAHRKVKRGLQIISEIDFVSGKVESKAIDLDELIATVAPEVPTSIAPGESVAVDTTGSSRPIE